MKVKFVTKRLAKCQSNTTRSAFSSALIALLLCAAPFSASWAEEYVEEGYDTGDAYQQSYDGGGDYPDGSELDSNDAYNDSRSEVMEPTMDPDQAEMVREAKASCTQWAAESGLEGEDKQAFIDDCVYSQTGY